MPYLVFHPGAYVTGSEEQCLKLIAANLDKIIESNPGTTMLLIENTAGQGTNIGYTFEQLATIYKQLHNKQRVGICFDTCHAFAAGYDFTTKETYQAMWRQFGTILGLDLLKVIHVNDCMNRAWLSS